MSTEDELRRQLRKTYGDPGSTDPGSIDAPGPTGSDDWAAVEVAGAQRARRTRVLVGAVAAVTVLVLGVGLVVAVGHRAGDTSLTDVAGPAGETTVGSAASTGSTDPGGAGSIVAGPTTTAGGVIPSITDPSAPSTATTRPSGPPPPTVATTTTTNAAGQVDCGTRYLASGWPTTTVPYPGFADCIQQAFASGTSAIYVERAQTDGEGGHIEITTYEVVGARLVRRTVDSTGAQPPGGVVVSTCTGLTHDSQVVVASGCHA